jgi:putative effector of murein hydrolase LrgA (UPF0299 family)
MGILKYRREMLGVGVVLLCLPAGVVVIKLLEGHPTWPAAKVFDLVVTALIGLAVLIVTGLLVRAESRKSKAERRERDLDATL